MLTTSQGVPVTHRDSASPYHTVELKATIRLIGSDVCAQICQLRSVSLGGAFVEPWRLSVGTRVNLTFAVPLNDVRLSLDAAVQWTTEEGVGVQFDGLAAWEEWALWCYLESLVYLPLSTTTAARAHRRGQTEPLGELYAGLDRPW